MPRSRKLPWLLTALVLVLAGCEPSSSTAFVATNLGVGEDGWRGVPLELDPPRTLPDVVLEDVDGDPVALADDFDGSPVLLFFGYTSCPDICPIHLRTIASAMSSLGVTTQQIRVVFVSVDPERDTPERIREFTTAFDRSFVGLHGDIEVVADALGQLDLPGPVVEGPDPSGEGNLIGHPAQVIGFDHEGIARRVWPFGARRADWIADLPRILEEWTPGGEVRQADEDLPPPVDPDRAGAGLRGSHGEGGPVPGSDDEDRDEDRDAGAGQDVTGEDDA